MRKGGEVLYQCHRKDVSPALSTLEQLFTGVVKWELATVGMRG
jgi:hypothetical protein